MKTAAHPNYQHSETFVRSRKLLEACGRLPRLKLQVTRSKWIAHCGRLSRLNSICCSWDSPSSLVMETKTCSATCGIQNVNRHGVHTGSKNSIRLKESSNCNTIFCVHFLGKIQGNLTLPWWQIDARLMNYERETFQLGVAALKRGKLWKCAK